jgi:hypothetical protein
MGRVIQTGNAKIPPLTPELLENLAIEGYLAARDLMQGQRSFDALEEDKKDAWRAAARAMYATIAMRGGATERTAIAKPH